MKIKISTKLSENNRSFLKKIAVNSIKISSENEFMTYSDSLDKIEKYFKINNSRYLEMVKLKVRNNSK